MFHAGTKTTNGTVVTSGGRVLAVTAYGSSIERAVELVYQGVDQISFEGKTLRRDIAHRLVKTFGYLRMSWADLTDSSIRALKTSSAHSPSVGLTYAQAGVSVDAGNALVEAIKPHVRATRRSGADAEIGGFGGVFDLKAVGYKDPILVSGTDGVGTKLRVAVDVGVHDLVGMLLTSIDHRVSSDDFDGRYRSCCDVCE